MANILVTGGSGMVGKHLQKLFPNVVFLSQSHENGGDLKDFVIKKSN